MSNGDYLITGGPERHGAFLLILDKSLTKPPKIFDIEIEEGPAVARNELKIAYTGDQHTKGIQYADIVYRNGEPFLENVTQIISPDTVEIDGEFIDAMLEPQNFRPPDNKELVWNTYRGVDPVLYNFNDKKNSFIYRNTKTYDEAEGIFPDGKYTCVESDEHCGKGIKYLDIYAQNLENPNDRKRLTFFNSNDPLFKSSNPVVRDDGKYMAFQEAKVGDAPGIGRGLYIYNLNYKGNIASVPSP